jgi:hypothetical protein
MIIGARADCCGLAARSAICADCCAPAERTAEDLWAVGPSDVTQPETMLIRAAAMAIFHMPAAPSVECALVGYGMVNGR